MANEIICFSMHYACAVIEDKAPVVNIKDQATNAISLCICAWFYFRKLNIKRP